MVDLQRRVRRRKTGKGRKWNLSPGGRPHISIFERVWPLLKFRGHLHDYVILIERAVHDGNLPLPKVITQSFIHLGRSNTEPCCRLAVNYNLGLQSMLLLVSIDVA